MRDAIEHESVGRLLETYAFIEPTGIFLCLYVYKLCIEMYYGSINGVKHHLFSVALASYGSDDSTDGNLFHVSSCRTYTSQGNNSIFIRQPQVNGFLIITIHVLINAVLLYHKYLATHSQEFV